MYIHIHIMYGTCVYVCEIEEQHPISIHCGQRNKKYLEPPLRLDLENSGFS